VTTQQIRVVLSGDSAGLEAAGSRGTRTLDNLVRSSGNASRTLTQLQGSTAANTRQMALLAPQVTDVVTSLAGGQNPMLVLIQQGGQLRDVFGGIRPALSAISSLFTTTRVVIGGLAAGVGLLAKAYLDGQADSERFRDITALTGNAAGVTEGQFSRMAERVAAAANVSQGAARELGEGLLATGQIGSRAMESLGTAAARYADVSGKSSDEVLELFGGMVRGVGDWAVKQNETMNFLTAADVRRIRSMEEVGDKQGAMILVGDKLIDHLKDQATNLGYVERAIKGVKNAWGALAEAVTNWGRADTTEARLATLSAMLDREREALAFAQERSAGRSQEIAGRTLAIGKIQDEMAALRENIKLERQAADAKARTAQVNQAAIAKDEKERKDKPKKGRSQDSIDAEYQRMVRETLANRPPRLAEIEAQGYEQVAQFEREQLIASARASQQQAREQERERLRAVDQARDMGAQLLDEAAATNARLITDDAARADAQLEIERATIQRRIDLLAAAGADVRSLEDDLATYMVARRAEANEQLKPQWQRMLEGWRDTNRLMRDSWDEQVVNGLRSGEDAFAQWASTGKLNVKSLIQTIIAEQARLKFREAASGSGLFGTLVGLVAGAFGGGGGVGITNSSTGSLVSNGLGGGRARGGGVLPRSVHPVVEEGEPELLTTRRGTYLLTGAEGGQVTPVATGRRAAGVGLGGGGGAAGQAGGPPQITIVNNGTPVKVDQTKRISRDEYMLLMSDATNRGREDFAGAMANPNSPQSRAIAQHFRVERKRA
jgi:phage-related minor tail protein